MSWSIALATTIWQFPQLKFSAQSILTVFITLGTLNRPDLHFESAGNGPVVITWIDWEHELYSGASLISLVDYCVTFRHDRRLLSLLGFVHNWPTSRWSATKNRKPVFIKRKWNHIVSSRATILSFHPVYIIQIYVHIYTLGHVRWLTFYWIDNNLERRLEELGIRGRFVTIQIIPLLRSTRTQRRVQETWRDLLSLWLLWITISSP